MKFAVYLEGEKRKTEMIGVSGAQPPPPVCQELACRSISFILPQNRLLSSSCLTQDSVRMELDIAYDTNTCLKNTTGATPVCLDVCRFTGVLPHASKNHCR